MSQGQAVVLLQFPENPPCQQRRNRHIRNLPAAQKAFN
jgi:hypothetical protein